MLGFESNNFKPGVNTPHHSTNLTPVVENTKWVFIQPQQQQQKQ